VVAQGPRLGGRPACVRRGNRRHAGRRRCITFRAGIIRPVGQRRIC
jgi:hypothetical protein